MTYFVLRLLLAFSLLLFRGMLLSCKLSFELFLFASLLLQNFFVLEKEPLFQQNLLIFVLAPLEHIVLSELL